MGGFEGAAAAGQDEGERPGPYGCGRDGRAVLPLPTAAAVSTGLRVQLDQGVEGRQRKACAWPPELLRILSGAPGYG